MHLQDTQERVFGSRAKIKILRTLYTMKESELTGREIARRCQLTPARTHAVLKELAGEGLVKMRVLGRNHMYAFNPYSILMQGVRVIFDDAYSPESYLRRIVSEELGDRRIFSVILCVDRLQKPEEPLEHVRMMAITDSDLAPGSLTRRVESVRERIQKSLGGAIKLRILGIDEFRSLLGGGDQEIQSALDAHILLSGESPKALASENWRSQRFRFPLFRRS